ncbi:hypothetical protein ABT160_33475 [Streptomyces sp. NPDC001941]|uniref:hypothetical protein n=1 Tax=Streptomyces sp. NPDC001941 TaxID=3154659 RepID=UPI00331CF052
MEMDSVSPLVSAARAAGWLLRASRCARTDPRLRSVRSFALLVGDGPRPVNASTVSRWENGLLPLPFTVVRRYEEVLGLPSHSLVSVIETHLRYHGGRPVAGPPLGRPPTEDDDAAHRRLDELLDRVLGEDVVTGVEWDELTSRLTTEGYRVTPSASRTALCERLLDETIASSGLPWMQRFEALSRLLAHGHWAEDIISLCADAARDPYQAGLIEVVCLLDGSDRPAATATVLRQLLRPTNGDAHLGALLASVRKLRGGHFRPEEATTVARAVAGLVHESAMAPEIAELVGALIGSLPLSQRERTAFTRRTTAHAGVQEVVRHGRLVEPGAGRVVLARVLSRVPALPAAHAGPDAVLANLVDEVLHHPVPDVRLYSAMLLRASPYREAVAASVAAELRSSATLAAAERTIPLLQCLRVLGGPRQREAVMGLTVARGLPDSVVRAAIHAIGHVEGLSSQHYWHQLLRHHATGRRFQDAELKRLVYGMAMAGEAEILRHFATEGSGPLSALAAWWTNLPVHVRASARA